MQSMTSLTEKVAIGLGDISLLMLYNLKELSQDYDLFAPPSNDIYLRRRRCSNRSERILQLVNATVFEKVKQIFRLFMQTLDKCINLGGNYLVPLAIYAQCYCIIIFINMLKLVFVSYFSDISCSKVVWDFYFYLLLCIVIFLLLFIPFLVEIAFGFPIKIL